MARSARPLAPGPQGAPDLAALGEAVRRAEDENAEGHPADARRLLRPVLAVLPDDTDEPDVVRVRAWALIELVRSEAEVRGSAERALAELDRMVADARPGVGWPGLTPAVLGLHGLLAVRAGRLDEALGWLDRAIAHVADAEPLDACRMLLNRGVVHGELRDLAEARADYLECARRAKVAGFARLAFKAEHNLGHLDYYAGRLPQALARMEAAAQTLPGRRPIALLDRAQVLLEAGLVAVADRTLAEAAELFAAQHLPHDVGECELGRAECAMLRGDPQAARWHAAAARRLFRRRGDRAWVLRATQLELQADAAVLSRWPADDEAGARARWATLSSRAARLEDQCRQAGRPLWVTAAKCVRIEADLARGAVADPHALFTELGPIPRSAPIGVRLAARRARVLLEQAAGRRRAAVAEVKAGQRELRLHRARFGSLDLRTAGAVHGAALADLDAQLAIGTRRPSAVLDAAERVRTAIAGTPRAVPHADPVSADLLGRLRFLAGERAGVLGGPQAEPGRERVVAETERLKREILARSWHERGREADDRAARMSDVRRVLGVRNDEVVLDMLEHRGELFAVRADTAGARLTALGPSAPVQEAVRRVHADLEVLANPLVPGNLRAVARTSLDHGLALLTARFSPVLPDDDRTLVVVASGWLGVVPWTLLPRRAGRPTVVAPSVRHWLSHAGTAPAGPSPVTAVAGPGLALAEREAREVARLWPGGAAVVGPEATAARTADLLAAPGIVHLAAHGRHEPENPLFSSVRMADGPLFAHELDTAGRPPHLVLLSSCEVGRASARAGGEALGLASVLLRTGVACVVAAIAPLPDEVALAVMTRTHELLREGRPVASALVMAAAELSDATGDPVPLTAFGAPV
ncbi:MAG TPA: CHAT domain-containing protein [Friedmanniella sp.]